MRAVAGIIIAVTLVEFLIIGIRVEMFFLLIARILILIKLLGIDVKLGWIIGMEITTVAFYLLYAIVFKLDLLYVNIITMIVSSLFVIIVQLWDSYNYIYVEEVYYGEDED